MRARCLVALGLGSVQMRSRWVASTQRSREAGKRSYRDREVAPGVTPRGGSEVAVSTCPTMLPGLPSFRNACQRGVKPPRPPCLRARSTAHSPNEPPRPLFRTGPHPLLSPAPSRPSLVLPVPKMSTGDSLLGADRGLSPAVPCSAAPRSRSSGLTQPHRTRSHRQPRQPTGPIPPGGRVPSTLEFCSSVTSS